MGWTWLNLFFPCKSTREIHSELHHVDIHFWNSTVFTGPLWRSASSQKDADEDPWAWHHGLNDIQKNDEQNVVSLLLVFFFHNFRRVFFWCLLFSSSRERQHIFLFDLGTGLSSSYSTACSHLFFAELVVAADLFGLALAAASLAALLLAELLAFAFAFADAFGSASGATFGKITGNHSFPHQKMRGVRLQISHHPILWHVHPFLG